MTDYQAAARDFIDNEKQFHLGVIPTEQSNPRTRNLSAAIYRDTAAGVKMILSADADIPAVARGAFASEAFGKLVDDIVRVMEDKRTVLISSVGASGRMALQLDSTWRLFWLNLINKIPARRAEFLAMCERCDSLMTGGDRAVVRSVENFEDYMTFGARQIDDAGVGEGDVVIALSECGLSASINGSAIRADEKGCKTYYLFCNPKEILCEHLERCRKVFAREGIIQMPLYVGNMAVAGSTRMQVTTVELLVAGAALEMAADRWLKEHLTRDEYKAVGATALTGDEYADALISLSSQLSSGDALKGLAGMVEYEADTYRNNGLITYITHDYLQDILTDTTERQPTFTLPPFRKSDDHTSPVSWAYAKDPLYPSAVAWQHIFHRPIRGLDWTKDDYIAMGAAKNIVEHPPEVGSGEIEKYSIGCEDDCSRYGRHPARLVCVDINGAALPGGLEWYENNVGKFDGGAAFRFGEIPAGKLTATEFRVPVLVPHSLMELMPHLMIKLAFNVLSTATMAKIGRVWGNWMIQVLPTNKKLIDRSTRVIAQLANLPYEKACEEFFKSYLARDKAEEYRESYVVETLRRLGVDPTKEAEE